MRTKLSSKHAFRFRRSIRSICPCVLLFLISISLAAPEVAAQSPDATAIIRRTEQELRAKTEQGTVSMTVRTPDWQRTLEMDYWGVNPDKAFIRVIDPAKEAGTATLRLESNMWNYLPSVERIIKIPPSLMLPSWNICKTHRASVLNC